MRSLLFLFCCILLCSCVSTMKSSINDDGQQIPPNFGKEDVTLLVILKGTRSYDKYLEKNFAENYGGKYVIVDPMEARSQQYADKKKYRYIFDEDKTVNIDTYGIYQGKTRVGTQNVSSATAKFQLVDRLTGEVYKTKHGTGAFSAWMKAYIQELEKARLKNKQS